MIGNGKQNKKVRTEQLPRFVVRRFRSASRYFSVAERSLQEMQGAGSADTGEFLFFIRQNSQSAKPAGKPAGIFVSALDSLNARP